MTTVPVHATASELAETLILWDVDHTLIENGGVSKETYALAFELLTGKSPMIRPATDGRTDYLIMQELMSANKIESGAYVDTTQLRDALTRAMETNAPKLPVRGYALPGALNALQALKEIPGVIQSVLTGNIEPNAFAKLNAFELDSFVDLEVGGYGSDNIVRSKLVDVARAKVFTKYGRLFDQASTILIGDTPRDVIAARDGGAKVIAVATGTTNMAGLSAIGPDATLQDLTNLEEFLSTLVAVRNGH